MIVAQGHSEQQHFIRTNSELQPGKTRGQTRTQLTLFFYETINSKVSMKDVLAYILESGLSIDSSNLSGSFYHSNSCEEYQW